MEYFMDMVRHNYIYKGAEVERECRQQLKRLLRKIRQQATDTSTNEADEATGSRKILLLNCGQGEYALLLALVKKNWQVYACDRDKDKIDTARNCVAVPANLHYSTSVNDEIDYDYIDLGRGDVKTWRRKFCLNET